MKTTRQEVIQWGQDFLREVGIDSICNVCIANGGSCCFACKHLLDGVGCQSQNTGCTSWLCGYLLFIFHEANLLGKWNEFWDQVPGKAFRRDYTPVDLEIENWPDMQNLRTLTTLFGEDLRELTNEDKRYYTVKLNDTLFRSITAAYIMKTPNHSEDMRRLNRKLKRLTAGFQRYHTRKKDCIELS